MKNIKEKQKGIVSIFITMMIMIVSLAMVLGLTVIFVGHLRIVAGIGDSVIAFYAANAGVERLLYYRLKKTPPIGAPFGPETHFLLNEASYTIRLFECITTGKEHLESVGSFRGARRAVRVSF